VNYSQWAIITALILGCASSGQINGSRFTDHTYDFKIVFPSEYELSAQGRQSERRVQAIKWRGDMAIKQKPLFVVSAIDTTVRFMDIVQEQKNIHFEPAYYLSCDIDKEKNDIINGYNVHIVYYKGVAVEAATAFVELEDFVLKIEYIVDADYFDDDELIGIVKNISVMHE
jgi:hypothetical protein